MSKKPVILLCWGYNRKNWIEFFECLNEDFEFVYLFYMYRHEEKEVHTFNKRIFYTEYASAAHILNDIKPTKVIFMGLDGLLTVALNIQAKKFAIPTFFMVHGSASLSIEDYRDFKFKERSLIKESLTHKLGSWFFIFQFLIKALGFRHILSLPMFVRFQIQKTKMHPILAMEKNKTRLRKPDKYIVFSEEDVKSQMQVDDCKPEDFAILGNLEITNAINLAEEKGIADEGYLLYIETPLSIIEGNEFDINKLSIEENNALLNSMNEYALDKSLKLIVKLHPYSYVNNFFLQHPNIFYDKSAAKESLILNATAIIFYNSSLAIPALFFKPCCMFIIEKHDEFQATVAGLNICTVINYKDLILNPHSISFQPSNNESKQAFITKYIGAGADGKGVMRLRDTLLH